MFIVKNGSGYVAGINDTGLVLADSQAGAKRFEEVMRGFWAGDPAYELVTVKEKKRGKRARNEDTR